MKVTRRNLSANTVLARLRSLCEGLGEFDSLKAECYIADLEARLATTQRELAEARKLAQWTPITSENLPKIGDEVLELWVISERRNLSIATYDWNEEDMEYHTNHAKAYNRPINPPKDTPSK